MPEVPNWSLHHQAGKLVPAVYHSSVSEASSGRLHWAASLQDTGFQEVQ